MTFPSPRRKAGSIPRVRQGTESARESLERRSVVWRLVATSVAIGTALLAGRVLGRGGEDPTITETAARVAAVADVELRTRDIAFVTSRVVRDPASAEDLAWLSALYLQRARETGVVEDYRRAEAAARRSLAIRTNRNEKTRFILASSLLALHEFPEAREAAERLVADAPEVVPYRALLAELQLEMGDYDAAGLTFESLTPHAADIDVAPRLARWGEIRGETQEARRFLYSARDSAARRIDLPREQLAWFHLRIADFELRHGNLRLAARAFEAGLRLRPEDPRLLGGLARLAAMQGRWEAAIDYAERAGDAADLATLTLLGDAHAALGHSESARRYYDAVEAAAAANPEPFNRQWTQFRLDHDRHLPETLALLRDEIRVRQDMLGYDMLAWALYKVGRFDEARLAISQALRMGTRDAAVLFHAGLIEKAVGNDEAARRHLREALRVNPFFHSTHAAAARAALSAAADNPFPSPTPAEHRRPPPFVTHP